ncbi:lprJ [Mycobacterium tuberculosis]|nr:lprJ [Mycobacterium tuberculosis]
MVFAPGGSFDAIAARVADDSGISHEAAGAFTLIAIATYCPAILGPLLSDRRPA